MKRRIYLLGLRHSEYPFVKEEKEALSLSSDKNMLVIDFARDSKEKIIEKKKEDIKRFKKLGAKKIEFASDLSDKGIKEKLIQIDLLYIAGGDTELLSKQINKKNLTSLIKSFNGIIIGNSAGTYICCKEYVNIKDNNVKIIPALGIVDICCKVHYKPEFDSSLLKASKGKKIYAIPDGSVIIVEDGRLSFVKEIYLFENGKKEEIN